MTCGGFAVSRSQGKILYELKPDITSLKEYVRDGFNISKELNTTSNNFVTAFKNFDITTKNLEN